MTGPEAEDGIRELFAAYAAGFDDADAAAITALFAWPATIWQFGEGHVFEDEEELAENVEALIDVFDEAGIVLTTADLRDVRIAAGAAFASVAWRQEDQAGNVLHAFTCHYLLVYQGGSWRIATVANESETEEGAV
jgi:ketosteroid isomerase-like protein